MATNSNKFIPDEQAQETFNLQPSYNDYEDFVKDFVEGFISVNVASNTVVDSADIIKWLSNPDDSIEEIQKFLTYCYISDGAIYQLYDLLYTLSDLNYSVKSFTISKKTEKQLKEIHKLLLKTVRYKEVTRDLLSQLASKGTVVCTWLGSKKKPYLYIFDNLNYVFPAYRRNGEMIAVIDLEWFDDMQEETRQSYFKSLSPLVTESKYNAYRQNPKENQYVELPPAKTEVLRNDTLSRNQRLGLPKGTQALLNIQHKQKMKDLEMSVANKIIRAIATIKFQGKDSNDVKVSENRKKAIFKEVKRVLERNQTNDGGISVIGIPDFATFEFPDMGNSDKVLSANKYDSVNYDIDADTGIASTLKNGQGGNFASGKLNLEMIYKKIGIMLEKIEKVFDKLIDIQIGSDDFMMEFDKTIPLTKKEKVDILMKLHQEGFAVKPILDLIDGVDYNEYVEQSIYEINNLKLREKIIPPALSFTGGKNDMTDTAKKTKDVKDVENQNTLDTKGNDGNNMPKAGV